VSAHGGDCVYVYVYVYGRSGLFCLSLRKKIKHDEDYDVNLTFYFSRRCTIRALLCFSVLVNVAGNILTFYQKGCPRQCDQSHPPHASAGAGSCGR
jgi:hypothetical protein